MLDYDKSEQFMKEISLYIKDLDILIEKGEWNAIQQFLIIFEQAFLLELKVGRIGSEQNELCELVGFINLLTNLKVLTKQKIYDLCNHKGKYIDMVPIVKWFISTSQKLKYNIDYLDDFFDLYEKLYPIKKKLMHKAKSAIAHIAFYPTHNEMLIIVCCSYCILKVALHTKSSFAYFN